MRLITQPYLTQFSKWPKTGRHILAQYDDQTIVLYQAYRPACAIEDIPEFVQQQRQKINSDYRELITPQESVYSVVDTKIPQKLELSARTE